MPLVFFKSTKSIQYVFGVIEALLVAEEVIFSKSSIKALLVKEEAIYLRAIRYTCSVKLRYTQRIKR